MYRGRLFAPSPLNVFFIFIDITWYWKRSGFTYFVIFIANLSICEVYTHWKYELWFYTVFYCIPTKYDQYSYNEYMTRLHISQSLNKF